jgi:hypothetical protein
MSENMTNFGGKVLSNLSSLTIRLRVVLATTLTRSEPTRLLLTTETHSLQKQYAHNRRTAERNFGGSYITVGEGTPAAGVRSFRRRLQVVFDTDGARTEFYF